MTTSPRLTFGEVMPGLDRWAPTTNVPSGTYPDSYRRTTLASLTSTGGNDCTGCANFRMNRGQALSGRGICHKFNVFTSKQYVCGELEVA